MKDLIIEELSRHGYAILNDNDKKCFSILSFYNDKHWMIINVNENKQLYSFDTYVYSVLRDTFIETTKYLEIISTRFEAIKLHIDENTCRITAESIVDPATRDVCQVVDRFRKEVDVARDLIRNFAFAPCKNRYNV